METKKQKTCLIKVCESKPQVAPVELHILTQSSTAPSLKEEVKDIFVCQEIAENNQSFRQGGVERRAKFLEVLVVKCLLPSGRLYRCGSDVVQMWF
jgi:hypothetical protein